MIRGLKAAPVPSALAVTDEATVVLAVFVANSAVRPRAVTTLAAPVIHERRATIWARVGLAVSRPSNLVVVSVDPASSAT